MCLAVPGEVLSIAQEQGLRFGKVRFGGVTRRVCLEYVPDVQLGEFVVVHVGFAISKLDREEAERTLALLAELDPASLEGETPEEGG